MQSHFTFHSPSEPLHSFYYLRFISRISSDVVMTQSECTRQNKQGRYTDCTWHFVTTDKRIHLAEGTVHWGSKLMCPTGCHIIPRLLWYPFRTNLTTVNIKGTRWRTLSGKYNIQNKVIYGINTNTWIWHTLTQGTIPLMYLRLLLCSGKWHHALR
jgi:hypothetical protein